MGAIHEGLEAKTFDQPDGIVQARVCKKSGLLATDLCEEAGCAYSESFASGTVPTDSCETHVAVTVCTESGLPPTEYCPEDLIETKIFIQRTAEQLEAINPDDYGKIQDFADELPAGQTPDDSSSDVQCNIHTKEWYESNKQQQQYSRSPVSAAVVARKAIPAPNPTLPLHLQTARHRPHRLTPIPPLLMRNRGIDQSPPSGGRQKERQSSLDDRRSFCLGASAKASQ
ncbi:MAG: hypothetical protein ACLTXL_06970 [Clostridia bacterium]